MGFSQKNRSISQLTTGNGLGFQVYDTRTHSISAFFDSPTRFVSAHPKDPSADGPEHRNLIRSFSFAVSDNKGKWTRAQDTKTTKKGATYLDQTHVITETLKAAPATFTQNFFSPFSESRNMLIANLEASSWTSAYAEIEATIPPPNQALKKSHRMIREIEGVPGSFAETGSGPGLLIYAASAKNLRALCVHKNGATSPLNSSKDCPTLRLEAAGIETGFSVGVQYLENNLHLAKEARHLQNLLINPHIIKEAVAEMNSWRKDPAPKIFQNSDERELWRQSETVLRMSQLREENRSGRINNGMILASLPPGKWSIAWVRDMAYAIVALARTGHYLEAKKALDSMLNAAPVGLYKKYVKNSNYRISITRYSGDGAEQGDYSENPTPNVELDGWGLVLWAARQYLDFSHDKEWLKTKTRDGSVFEALLEGVAQPIEENMETFSQNEAAIMASDSSIWESHMSDARHYAFTTMAAARGICDMAAIAIHAGRTQEATRFSQTAKKLRLGFNQKFVHEKGIYGALERSKEKDVDSSTVEAVLWGLLDDPKTTPRLLKSFSVLKTSFGGYRRNLGKSEYEQHEFLWVDFKLSEVFRRQGKITQSKELLEKIVRVSQSNFGLIAENYNTIPTKGLIGSYIDSFPMVGYGAGLYMITLLERAQISPEDQSCHPQEVTSAKLDLPEHFRGSF